MRLCKKVVMLTVMCFIVLSHVLPATVNASTGRTVSSETQEHILSELRNARIPNAAIAIIQDGEVSHIFKDSTQDTLFQIGSVSKSFTGFGVLLLEDDGLLSVNDPVNQHLPWFEVYYQGVPVPHEDITIGNLLHHTSGFTSHEGHFAPTHGLLSTDEFIAQVVGSELAFYPSEMYVYGNINYVILGFIIEAVSGLSYDDFMTQNVLHPLGLYNTFTNPKRAYETGMVIGGNRLGFLRTWSRDVPFSTLAIPTGFIYSNIADMRRWAAIHLGMVDVGEQFSRVVQQSHVHRSNYSHAFADKDWHYATGWVVCLESGDMWHDGMTPGYATSVIMSPYRNTAVVVLTNLNHGAIGNVSDFVLDTINSESFNALPGNPFAILDLIFTIVTTIGAIATLLFVLFVLRLIKKVRSGYRIRFKVTFKKIILLIMPLTLLVITIGGYVLMPVLMDNSSAFLMLYSPASAIFADISLIAMTVYAWCLWLAKVFVSPR